MSISGCIHLSRVVVAILLATVVNRGESPARRIDRVAATSPTAGREASVQTSVPAGADLQAYIDRARPGDVLLLEPGATYVGNFMLPALPGSRRACRPIHYYPIGRRRFAVSGGRSRGSRTPAVDARPAFSQRRVGTVDQARCSPLAATVAGVSGECRGRWKHHQPRRRQRRAARSRYGAASPGARWADICEAIRQKGRSAASASTAPTRPFETPTFATSSPTARTVRRSAGGTGRARL